MILKKEAGAWHFAALSTVVTLVLLALPAAAIAQDLHWKLPDRGAVRYERDLVVEATCEPKGATDSRPWSGFAASAVVLDGELDAKKQGTAEPLCDLRNLLPRLCLDLSQSKAGKAKVELRSVHAMVDVDAQWGPLQASGEQTVKATIHDAEPARLGAERGHRPLVHGTLVGSRLLDRENGRVQHFEGGVELEAKWFDQARTVRITLRDAWTFDEVLVPSDPKVRTMVNEAIRKAADWLDRDLQQRIDNKGAGNDPYHDHHPGELALSLLAIVKGRDDSRHETVQRGYEDLRRRNIEGTYSLGAAILAIEALYTPIQEWQNLREGTIEAPMSRKLPPSDLALVQEWAKRLLDNIDTTTDPAYLRRYHYGPSSLWDNSTTQYALLGLYAAQLCGVTISPQVWTASATHLLACDRPEGKETAPTITSHAEHARIEQGKKSTRSGGKKVQPAGFGYQDGHDLTGSMTTAGISGLSLCAAALRAQKKGTQKQFAEIDAGIRSSFAWLEQRLTVRRNPGPTHVWDSWHNYYLYGLERACELNRVAWLGGRDWYFEGAMHLIAQQQQSGSWGNSVETAFALLFLKKTVLPTITGK